MELDSKDRQTKREKPAAKIAHRLALANHENSARDKQRADEEQESGLRSAWPQSNGNCNIRVHSERVAAPTSSRWRNSVFKGGVSPPNPLATLGVDG